MMINSVVFQVNGLPVAFCVFLFCLIFSVKADTIVLCNGDVIHGSIAEQTDDHVVIVHPNLGTFQISMEEVESLSAGSDEDSEEQGQLTDETPKTDDDEIPDSVWFMPKFERLNDWATWMRQKGFKMSLDLSMDGTWGDTEEQSLRLGYTLKREVEDIRMNSDVRYYHKTKRSETTDNELSIGYRKDWLLSDSRWFYFYESRYDLDDFESWRHRVAGHGGPGYGLVDTNRWKLNLLAGPGVKKEWGSDNDDVKFEGIAQLDIEWNISKRLTLTGYSAYYPVLTDSNDYRTRSGLIWRFFMSRELDFHFLLGLEHEYMNIVDPGSHKNDTRLYMGVGYNY